MFVHEAHLVLGQAFGAAVLNAELPGRVTRGACVIAGEKHRSHPGIFEGAHGLRGVGTGHVGKGDESGRAAVHGNPHDGTAFVHELRGPGNILFGRGRALAGEKCGAACGHASPFHGAAHAAAGNHLKIFAVGNLPLFTEPLNHGAAERVLRTTFRPGAEAVEFPV